VSSRFALQLRSYTRKRENLEQNGASGHIALKHRADSNGSRYRTEEIRESEGGRRGQRPSFSGRKGAPLLKKASSVPIIGHRFDKSGGFLWKTIRGKALFLEEGGRLSSCVFKGEGGNQKS
jgi:hypothetical protein